MHGFSFRLHSYYVSGEASLSKWKDADMDIQCIWLELILNVLQSVEYVGTVINWHIVHVLIDYKINFKSFICLCCQAYTYPHAHTGTFRHTYPNPGAVRSGILETGSSHFLPVSGEICPLAWSQSFLWVAPEYCLRRSKAESQRRTDCTCPCVLKFTSAY